MLQRSVVCEFYWVFHTLWREKMWSKQNLLPQNPFCSLQSRLCFPGIQKFFVTKLHLTTCRSPEADWSPCNLSGTLGLLSLHRNGVIIPRDQTDGGNLFLKQSLNKLVSMRVEVGLFQVSTRSWPIPVGYLPDFAWFTITGLHPHANHGSDLRSRLLGIPFSPFFLSFSMTLSNFPFTSWSVFERVIKSW